MDPRRRWWLNALARSSSVSPCPAGLWGLLRLSGGLGAVGTAAARTRRPRPITGHGGTRCCLRGYAVCRDRRSGDPRLWAASATIRRRPQVRQRRAQVSAADIHDPSLAGGRFRSVQAPPRRRQQQLPHRHRPWPDHRKRGAAQAARVHVPQPRAALRCLSGSGPTGRTTGRTPRTPDTAECQDGATGAVPEATSRGSSPGSPCPAVGPSGSTTTSARRPPSKWTAGYGRLGTTPPSARR